MSPDLAANGLTNALTANERLVLSGLVRGLAYQSLTCTLAFYDIDTRIPVSLVT